MTNEIRDEADIDNFVQRFETAATAGVPDLLSRLYNDHGNAERLIAMYGEDLRYCHAFKKWLVWDGKRWAVDDTDQCRRRGKQAMLEFLRLAIERGDDEKAEKFARASLDARRISSMLSMAECEIFVRPPELDTDPFALNFLNGTVDLRTGELREHRRSDFITKLVWYRYVPTAECPRWQAFLNQVMGGGPDAGGVELDRAQRLVAYLRRALGYSLTGTTIEKAVFIPFGNHGATAAIFHQAVHAVVGLKHVEYAGLGNLGGFALRKPGIDGVSLRLKGGDFGLSLFEHGAKGFLFFGSIVEVAGELFLQL